MSREFISAKELPFAVERKKANEILNSLIKKNKKKFKAEAEEDCVVQPPIYGTLIIRGGIDVTYYFLIRGFGVLHVYIGDAPEDCFVKWLDKHVIQIVK